MKKFLEEFKTFAMKGNVIDLAVAVVIGAAFGKIVSSLVDNIIMPSVGVIVGGVNFSSLSFSVGDSMISYGIFLQSVVDFIIIAFVIFVVVKVINNLQRKEEAKPEKEKAAIPSEEVKLLREIRDTLQNNSSQ